MGYFDNELWFELRKYYGKLISVILPYHPLYHASKKRSQGLNTLSSGGVPRKPARVSRYDLAPSGKLVKVNALKKSPIPPSLCLGHRSQVFEQPMGDDRVEWMTSLVVNGSAQVSTFMCPKKDVDIFIWALQLTKNRRSADPVLKNKQKKLGIVR